MERAQIYALTNNALKETLGETTVLSEDLSNVVDMGEAVFNANAVESYTRSLVNHIGKVIFVDRAYRGRVPSVMMDAWEFGSVVEKISMDLPDAEENESWELQDGAIYSNEQFYKPSVEAKFFNKRVTFEIPVSITERQIKESFSNAGQLNAFISMIYNATDKAMNVRMDNLIMRTINNFIAETINAESSTLGSGYAEGSGVRAINLLYLYNTILGAGNEITAEEAMRNAGFLKFAGYTIATTAERMGVLSTLFNVGGKPRFTSKDMLHVVMLADFAKSTETYLESDTFNNELVSLKGLNAELVPYWQGSGTSYDWDDITNINVKTGAGNDVDVDGVVCVMFDRDALGVSCLDRRTTTAYNAKAEFYNNYNKFDAGYYNDLNENGVVFFLA